MFARTARLMLRPGWPEDAPALVHAIAHAPVAMNLTRLPWPYALADAQAFLAQPPAIHEPRFLIFDDPSGRPRLVGGIGIRRDGDANELGYWFTPEVWGRGYASEAGAVVIQAARALGMARLTAAHFTDNPASGRVLTKLGFHGTGYASRHSAARGAEVDCALFEQELADTRAMRLAA